MKVKKELTEVGFKRVVNRNYPLSTNYKRAFVKCKRKECGTKAFYDYVPYSLSNPIMIALCGHDVKREFESF